MNGDRFIFVNRIVSRERERMKDQGINQGCTGSLELEIDDLLQHWRTIQMQLIFPPEKMKGIQQPDEAEEMIPVKMADEDLPDALEMNVKPPYLQLGSFRTVDQKQTLIHVEQMSAWVSRQRWNSRIASEDC